MKLLPYILFEKYIYILALEMASPGNQHCANCIGTLSFPIVTVGGAGGAFVAVNLSTAERLLSARGCQVSSARPQGGRRHRRMLPQRLHRITTRIRTYSTRPVLGHNIWGGAGLSPSLPSRSPPSFPPSSRCK